MTTRESSEYQKMCSRCGKWKPIEDFSWRQPGWCDERCPLPGENTMKSYTVELPEYRYKELVRAEAWLRCLESAGVDNWEGISFAYELAEAEGVSDEE